MIQSWREHIPVRCRDVLVQMEEALGPQGDVRAAACEVQSTRRDALKAVNTRRREGPAQAFTELRLSEGPDRRFGLANDRHAGCASRTLGDVASTCRSAPVRACMGPSMSTSRCPGMMPWVLRRRA